MEGCKSGHYFNFVGMRVIILVLFLTYGLTSFGQSRLDSCFKSTESMGYISATEGIGNLPSMLFEGLIQNKFYLSIDKQSKWAIAFEPKVNVRMLMEHSLPIVNPSYHAIGDIMYKLKSDDKVLKFLAYRIGHHSNGQSDYFWDWSIQQIDFEDGNFMTNYLGIAYHDLKEKSWLKSDFLIRRKLELEVHPNEFRNPYLDEMYDDIRVNGTYVVRKDREMKRSMMLELESTILCETISMRGMLSGNSFTFRSRFSYEILKSTDFWAYAEFYHGQDYYNLYFNNILNVLKFGVLAVPSKSPIFH